MYYSALLGNPTDHSISPKLFRMIGEQYGIEYAHIKIDVNSKKFKKILNSLAYFNYY